MIPAPHQQNLQRCKLPAATSLSCARAYVVASYFTSDIRQIPAFGSLPPAWQADFLEVEAAEECFKAMAPIPFLTRTNALNGLSISWWDE
jgi:hypothetical protein